MQDFEEMTRDRFIGFVRASEGLSYEVDDRNVRNLTGPRNFDFLLSNNGETMALELTTLTLGQQDLNDSAHFDEFVRTVGGAVDTAKLSGHFLLHAPYGALWSLNKWRAQLRKYGPEVGDKITRAAKDLRQIGEEQEVRTSLDDYVIEKIAETPGCLWFNGVSPNEHWGDYQGFSFVRDTLKRILKKKNKQLDTPANRRILVISNLLRIDVITNQLRPPLSELVRKAIRQICNTNPLVVSNIDEIFFEKEVFRFEKVHDRDPA